jgi:hypothetical protein
LGFTASQGHVHDCNDSDTAILEALGLFTLPYLGLLSSINGTISWIENWHRLDPANVTFTSWLGISTQSEEEEEAAV